MNKTALPADLLMDYASGAASPGTALLVAAHLETSQDSLAETAMFESMSATLMDHSLDTPMAADALDAVLARIDEVDARTEPQDAPDRGPLPQAVASFVGIDFNDIPWRFRLPGVSEYVLDGVGPETVSLLRARPGSGVPQHTHEGREFTLVLTGQLEDGGIVFGPGDVAINTEEHDHSPRIIGTAVCHCLIVREGQLRFTGRFSRALNYLAE